MISRISLSLFVVLAIIIPVNAFITRGMGLVRFKAVDSITRPFLSTSDGSNLHHEVQNTTAQLEDQINQLQSEISATKIRRNELLPSDRDLAIALTGEITANTNLLNTLKSQQGTFASPIPPSFPILLDNILCPNLFQHILFTHPVSTESKGKS